ncbi:MAG: D-alanine--D-alanine ligase [Holosporales bacterium]|jgi:D-alanine-D-alanine ligase|nr:D-alanine--D-alanine ligase [Holosporales bacterium]
MKRCKRVVVLNGGTSSEREVSLVSGAAYVKALKELGHTVQVVDAQDNDWIARIRVFAPHVVINALHGTPGEDGTVQGILELLGIPYSHCGVMTSAIAMDKEMSKAVFRDAGIPVPEGMVLSWDKVIHGDPFPRPFILKPLREGSSVGVHIVTDTTDLSALRKTWRFGERILLEEYIPGRELVVSVFPDKALGILEIVPQHAFYDYETKYTDGLAQHILNPTLPEDVRQRTLIYARQAYDALKCRGAVRVDLRYNSEASAPHDIFVLELNTQSGMTPTSLLPDQARHAGMMFNELVQWTLDQARCDKND